ncbi:MAG: large conductance mechanosensitive channel protein MscL [Actinomycetota bacterium]
MRSFLKEFKEFIATGNMVELAVGVILGGAVGTVIKAFTDGVMMNLVAAIFGKPSFDDVLRIKLNDTPKLGPDGATVLADGTYLEFGKVITSLVTLVLTGLVLFLMIKAYNRLRRPEAEPAPAGPSELDLLTEIRDALRERP